MSTPIISLFVLVVLSGSALAAQNPFEPNAGEAIGELVGQAGASIAEYNRLSGQRKATIARLEKDVAQCAGRCAQKNALERELERWRRIDSQVKAMEGQALRSLGLGQYSDYEDLKEGLKQGLRELNAQYELKEKLRQVNQSVQSWCLNVKLKDSFTVVNNVKLLPRGAEAACFRDVMNGWAKDLDLPLRPGSSEDFQALMTAILAQDAMFRAPCNQAVREVVSVESQKMLDCKGRYSELSRLRMETQEAITAEIAARRARVRNR